MWAHVVGLDGFYPFDALAAAYAIEPKLFGCAAVAVWVAKDGRRWGGRSSPERLLVGLESERVEKDRGALARMRSAVASLWFALILQTVVIVVLVILLVVR